jgi:hypothetical protein
MNMKTDIDAIIALMKEFTPKQNKDEFNEQDAVAPASGGGGGAKPAYPTVTKWETGVARTGPANQIGLTKWSDIVKINRGKANTLL